MDRPINSGRPFNIEILRTSVNKVTLGFRCEPSTKLELIKESREIGITLREYVEMILNTRHSTK